MSTRLLRTGIPPVLALTAAFLAIPSDSPGRDGWHETYSVARAAAAKSGKDIFLCFTGKEWSAVCRKFEEHFLDQPEFTRLLKPHFEPVQLDLSRFPTLAPGVGSEDLPEEARLKLEFEVSTFPIAFLLAKDGMPYAVTGFRPGGIASYGQHLTKLRESRAEGFDALARARKASGQRRAELLAQGIPDLGDLRTARFYGDLMREVVELDPDDLTGKARDFELELADHDYVRSMRDLDQDLRWSDMVELTDAYIEKYALTGSRRQAALMNRFDIHRRQENLRKMVETLGEVIRINPYNPHGRQAEQFLGGLARQMEQQSLLESSPG